MAKTEGLRARHAELAHFARRKGWDRGRLGSYRVGRLTIGVGATGYPKPDFVATVRPSLESRTFKNLEDLERFVDAVRITGQIPAPG